MFKTLTLLKRRADIDMAEFVRRYEEGHSKLGERLLRGSATRYVRRYLYAVVHPETGEVEESEHDVVMEIWYPSRAVWEATMARLSTAETRAEIIADEETLFDRARNRFYILEEFESDLG